MRYKWLPSWEEVPKHLHESVLLSHLKELEVLLFVEKVCNTDQIEIFYIISDGLGIAKGLYLFAKIGGGYGTGRR